MACAICLLVLIGISASALAFARRGGGDPQAGAPAVGWFWFLGMIVPVSGIILIGDQSMADRYTYLSLTGIFIAVVFTSAKLLQGRHAVFGIAAFAAMLGLFAALAVVQVGYWRDSETLWRHVLATTRDNALAHVNLAAQLHERGPEGKNEAERLIAEALRIRPEDAMANNDRGLELADQGDWEGAVRHYRIAIQSRPGYTFAHVNLGVALGELGRWAQAETALREAVRLDPEFAPAENNLGYALAMQGHWSEAIEHYRRAILLDPSDVHQRESRRRARPYAPTAAAIASRLATLYRNEKSHPRRREWLECSRQLCPWALRRPSSFSPPVVDQHAGGSGTEQGQAGGLGHRTLRERVVDVGKVVAGAADRETAQSDQAAVRAIGRIDPLARRPVRHPSGPRPARRWIVRINNLGVHVGAAHAQAHQRDHVVKHPDLHVLSFFDLLRKEVPDLRAGLTEGHVTGAHRVSGPLRTGHRCVGNSSEGGPGGASVVNEPIQLGVPHVALEATLGTAIDTCVQQVARCRALAVPEPRVKLVP